MRPGTKGKETNRDERHRTRKTENGESRNRETTRVAAAFPGSPCVRRIGVYTRSRINRPRIFSVGPCQISRHSRYAVNWMARTYARLGDGWMDGWMDGWLVGWLMRLPCLRLPRPSFLLSRSIHPSIRLSVRRYRPSTSFDIRSPRRFLRARSYYHLWFLGYAESAKPTISSKSSRPSCSSHSRRFSV